MEQENERGACRLKILDRYVMKRFLRVLFWATLTFVTLYLLVDLFDHLDNFLDADASPSAIVRYYFYQMPFVLDMVLPVAMLLASLFTFALMGKNNEYVSLLSAGVNMARIGRTILIFAFAMSVAALLLRESVVPKANRRQADIERYEIEGQSRDPLRSKTNFEHMGQDGRIYVIQRFRARPPTLESVSIQTFNDSMMIRRVDARRASWEEDHWLLHDGSTRDFGADGESMHAFSQLRLDGPVEEPIDISRRSVDPDEMNYFELRDFADWVQRTGGDDMPYRASLAHKLSFPLVHFILVFLGLGLGARKRTPSIWAGFGVTVGLSFVYYLLMSFGLELGKTGVLSPWLSAWSGNLLYGGAGLALFVRANR